MHKTKWDTTELLEVQVFMLSFLVMYHWSLSTVCVSCFRGLFSKSILYMLQTIQNSCEINLLAIGFAFSAVVGL